MIFNNPDMLSLGLHEVDQNNIVRIKFHIIKNE